MSPPAGADSRPGAPLSNRNQADALETQRGVDDGSVPSAGDSPPFADLVSDDATIKATPVVELGADYHPTPGAASSAPDVGETINYFGQSVAPAPGRYEPPSVNQEMIGAQTGGESRGQMSPKAWDTGTEETLVGQPGLTTRMANATAASDALLDLGDIGRPPPQPKRMISFLIWTMSSSLFEVDRSTGRGRDAGSAGKVGVEAARARPKALPHPVASPPIMPALSAEAAHGGRLISQSRRNFPGRLMPVKPGTSSR